MKFFCNFCALPSDQWPDPKRALRSPYCSNEHKRLAEKARREEKSRKVCRMCGRGDDESGKAVSDAATIAVAEGECMSFLRRSRKPFAAPKPRKQSRVGKTGTVRLVGVDMSKLRQEVYLRAGGHCELRLDPNCRGQYVPWKSGELAHKRTKRNHGDSPANSWWSCGACHRIFHQYGPSGEKPCPPKASVPSEGGR